MEKDNDIYISKKKKTFEEFVILLHDKIFQNIGLNVEKRRLISVNYS